MRSSLDIEINGKRLAFSDRTFIAGVVNVTPDSFSDGGKFFDKKSAVEHGLKLAREGADIIDIGGESTRPGAEDVSAEEEISRVVPVIAALKKVIDIPISIDTRKSKVAEEAIKAGARILNDVSGLKNDKAMASVAAKHGVALIVMHMKGTPKDMQDRPAYKNLIREIIVSLKESIEIATSAGVSKRNIIIDPGIGFGKTAEHNLEILNRLDEFKSLERPICVGVSRKSFIGKALKIENSGGRLAGTLAASAIAIMKGANILRAHDVLEVKQAAVMADCILKETLI